MIARLGRRPARLPARLTAYGGGPSCAVRVGYIELRPRKCSRSWSFCSSRLNLAWDG